MCLFCHVNVGFMRTLNLWFGCFLAGCQPPPVGTKRTNRVIFGLWDTREELLQGQTLTDWGDMVSVSCSRPGDTTHVTHQWSEYCLFSLFTFFFSFYFFIMLYYTNVFVLHNILIRRMTVVLVCGQLSLSTWQRLMDSWTVSVQSEWCGMYSRVAPLYSICHVHLYLTSLSRMCIFAHVSVTYTWRLTFIVHKSSLLLSYIVFRIEIAAYIASWLMNYNCR